MKKRTILLLIIAVILVSVSFALFQYFRPPADTKSATPDFKMESQAMIKEFADDEKVASQKYIDKVIEVHGTVAEVSVKTATVFLKSDDPITSIMCNFPAADSLSLSSIKEGNTVTVKGFCTGKLSDIVLNRCTLTK